MLENTSELFTTTQRKREMEVEVAGGKVRGVALSNGVFQFTGIPLNQAECSLNSLKLVGIR
jgi:hypothetical protein